MAKTTKKTKYQIELSEIAAEHGWKVNDSLKKSMMFTRHDVGEVSICKETIQNTNQWRVSVIDNKGISDSDGLKLNDAIALVKDLLTGVDNESICAD